MNNPTFGNLLSFDKAEREIDLREIRKNSGIAYFQLADYLAKHDVLKQLRIGQAVLIEKSPSIVRGVQIPQFKELLGRV